MMYVGLAHQSGTCDKCKKPKADDNPILYLQVTTRKDKDTIYVHSKCLLKLLDKIKVSEAGSS